MTAAGAGVRSGFGTSDVFELVRFHKNGLKAELDNNVVCLNE